MRRFVATALFLSILIALGVTQCQSPSPSATTSHTATRTPRTPSPGLRPLTPYTTPLSRPAPTPAPPPGPTLAQMAAWVKYVQTLAWLASVPAPVTHSLSTSVSVPSSSAAPTPRTAVIPSRTIPSPTGTSDATSTNTADWACIRFHESTNNYGIIDPPYSGAYQFLDSTWESTTGLPGIAADYSPATQDAAALKLYAEEGWSPWSTRTVCGL